MRGLEGRSKQPKLAFTSMIERCMERFSHSHSHSHSGTGFFD